MLKRTCKPFHGKINTKIEHQAAGLMRRNDREAANEMFKASEKIINAKRDAHNQRGGRSLKVPHGIRDGVTPANTAPIRRKYGLKYGQRSA